MLILRNQPSLTTPTSSIPGDRRSQISRISFTEIQNFQSGLMVRSYYYSIWL